jgi:putative tricarboxylic transport membrane protein
MQKIMRKNLVADLMVLIALALLTGWYLYDAYSASTHVMNLILIVPLSSAIFVLCSIEFVAQLRAPASPASGELPEEPPLMSMVPVILLFIAYVLSLDFLGFDVGTMLFIAGFLLLQGERSIKWIAGYSLSFSLLTALFFSTMLPYPMPMLLLASEY